MLVFRVNRGSFCALLIVAACLAHPSALAVEPEPGVGTLDCVINPSVVADLGSSAPGILGRVHVDRSDFVTAGDTIAELDSGVEVASVDLARTRADSTAEVDLRRTNAAYGDRLRDRTKDLYKRKVVSNNDLDERETEARLAWIQLRQAKDNQSIAKLELVRAEEVLKRRTISSPITGVVMERFKVAGEYVEDQPVVRVAQLDPLHVEVIVPVDRLGMVTPGMTAEVWTDVVEGQRWVAEVARVDQVADVASGTYGVRLSLPNPDYKIPAGLRCQMQLVEAPRPVPAPEPQPATAARIPIEESETQSADPVDAVAVDASAPVQQPVEPGLGIEETSIAAEPLESVPVGAPPAPETNKAAVTASAEPASEKPAIAAQPSEPTPVRLPSAPETAEVVVAPSAEPASEKPAETTVESPEVEPVLEETQSDTARTEPDVDETIQVQALAMAKDERVCRVAGPYRDEIEATRHVVRLRRAGLDVEMTKAAKPTDVEYRIMTPVLADQAAADQVLRSLKSAGLSDFHVYPLPAGKRRVYLGVYNQEKPAMKRVEVLKQAGIKAFIRPSKAPGSSFFLVVRGEPGRDTDRLLSALPASPGGAVGELDLCDRGDAVSMR